MAWLLWIGSTAVLILLHKRWKKWQRWYVIGFFTALAGCSFAATALGGWAASLLGQLLGLPASLMNISAALLAAVAVLICLPLVIYGFVHDKKADKQEMAGLILLPLLVTIASGPVASTGGTFADAVTGFGTRGLSYLVGG